MRDGTCVSRLVGRQRSGVIHVALIAAWPLSAPQQGRSRGGWEVTLDANGRVLAVKLYRHEPATWR